MAPKKKIARHRDAQSTFIWGRNGTGKSTLVKEMVEKIGKPTLVVTKAGMPKIWRPYPVIDATDPEAYQFKGIRQVHEHLLEKDTFRYIYRYFRNGSLVLDDCKTYFPNTLDTHPYLKDIFVNYRHIMVDVYTIVHSGRQVPKRAWDHSTNVIIGATPSLLDKSTPIADVDRIIEMQRDVNRSWKAAAAKNDGSHYGIFKLVRL